MIKPLQHEILRGQTAFDLLEPLHMSAAIVAEPRYPETTTPQSRSYSWTTASERLANRPVRPTRPLLSDYRRSAAIIRPQCPSRIRAFAENAPRRARLTKPRIRCAACRQDENGRRHTPCSPFLESFQPRLSVRRDVDDTRSRYAANGYHMRLKSRRTSRAALRPGRPVTPPPGWDPAPHM